MNMRGESREYYHICTEDREMKLSMGASERISFDDREMKTAMLQICSAEFNADSPDSLHIASHPLTQPCLNISRDTPRRIAGQGRAADSIMDLLSGNTHRNLC